MSTLTGPVLAEYQDLFSSSSTAGGPNGGLNLGAKAYTGDGREFRYALAGATALVPGKLQQNAAETTGWEALSVTATAKGATSITTTTTLTATVNQMAGGYVMVTETPGQGYVYKIKSNPAVTSAAITIQLEDPILVALTTGSQIDIIPSPYSGVIINPTTSTGVPVGVAVFPVTAAQYGWIQVTGAANVLAQGAIAVGVTVCPSTSVAGAVVTNAAGSSSLATTIVGSALTGISDTDYGSVYLSLA